MTSLIERIAFYLFLGAIASLVVMGSLPAPKKLQNDATKISSSSSMTSLKKEELSFFKKSVESEKREEDLWLPLIRKHLWLLVYSKNKRIIFEAEQFFQKVPKEIAYPFVESLLNSSLPSEINMGAVAVRCLQLDSLLSLIIQQLPAVNEDNNDSRIPFYLAALEIGDKRAVSVLLPYLHSQNIHHRLIALESLTKTGDASIVPQLFSLIEQKKANAEFYKVQRCILQLIEPSQYSFLESLFCSPRADLRKHALAMMASLDVLYFIRFFKEALEDSDWFVRRQAYFFFLKQRDTSVALIFLKKAQNIKLSREEQIFALEVAVHCGKQLNSFEIVPFLSHPDPVFRFLGNVILVNQKDKNALENLIELLDVSEDQFILGQGTDLEEEKTWFFRQIHEVLSHVTQKEEFIDFSWKNWWKVQKKFQFPSFEYLEFSYTLYEER